MRWPILATATVALAAAVPARAQIPYRHFEQPYWDTNRSDRIAYYPLAKAFSGPRPGVQPYNVAEASWFQQKLGTPELRPSQVHDGAEYALNQFTMERRNGTRMLHVVITRMGGTPDEGVPQLRVTHAPSRISVTSLARVTRAADGGVRYTFDIVPPTFGFSGDPSVRDAAEPARYQVDLIPPRNLQVPSYIARYPTFGGEEWKTRMDQPPPRLPVEERVAGKRIEYRSGRVVSEKGK